MVADIKKPKKLFDWFDWNKKNKIMKLNKSITWPQRCAGGKNLYKMIFRMMLMLKSWNGLHKIILPFLRHLKKRWNYDTMNYSTWRRNFFHVDIDDNHHDDNPLQPPSEAFLCGKKGNNAQAQETYQRHLCAIE